MVLAVSIVGLGGTASDVSEGLTSSPTGRDPHRPTEARGMLVGKTCDQRLRLFDAF